MMRGVPANACDLSPSNQNAWCRNRPGKLGRRFMARRLIAVPAARRSQHHRVAYRDVADHVEGRLIPRPERQYDECSGEDRGNDADDQIQIQVTTWLGGMPG